MSDNQDYWKPVSYICDCIMLPYPFNPNITTLSRCTDLSQCTNHNPNYVHCPTQFNANPGQWVTPPFYSNGQIWQLINAEVVISFGQLRYGKYYDGYFSQSFCYPSSYAGSRISVDGVTFTNHVSIADGWTPAYDGVDYTLLTFSNGAYGLHISFDDPGPAPFNMPDADYGHGYVEDYWVTIRSGPLLTGTWYDLPTWEAIGGGQYAIYPTTSTPELIGDASFVLQAGGFGCNYPSLAHTTPLVRCAPCGVLPVPAMLFVMMLAGGVSPAWRKKT